MPRDLPAAIVWRRKRPLRAPVGAWLRGRLPDFAEVLLSPDRLGSDGYFDAAAVQALFARHRVDPCSDGHLLWTVLGVQLWHELFRRPAGRWAAEGGWGPAWQRIVHSWLVPRVVFPVYERLTGRRLWTTVQELRALQWRSPDELAARGVKRLRALLVHAHRHVPYYRTLFGAAGVDPAAIRRVEDLADYL